MAVLPYSGHKALQFEVRQRSFARQAGEYVDMLLGTYDVEGEARVQAQAQAIITKASSSNPVKIVEVITSEVLLGEYYRDQVIQNNTLPRNEGPNGQD